MVSPSSDFLMGGEGVPITTTAIIIPRLDGQHKMLPVRMEVPRGLCWPMLAFHQPFIGDSMRSAWGLHVAVAWDVTLSLWWLMFEPPRLGFGPVVPECSTNSDHEMVEGSPVSSSHTYFKCQLIWTSTSDYLTTYLLPAANFISLEQLCFHMFIWTISKG